jgi:hypothetical protein
MMIGHLIVHDSFSVSFSKACGISSASDYSDMMLLSLEQWRNHHPFNIDGVRGILKIMEASEERHGGGIDNGE